jgi:hypothetical protein
MITAVSAKTLIYRQPRLLARTQNLLFIVERCLGVLGSEQVGVGLA